MATTKKINDGFIKLTKENISKGQLGDKIKSIRFALLGITVSFTRSLKPSDNGCNKP